MRTGIAAPLASTMVALGLLAAPAHAAQPVHIEFPVDISYELTDLSDVCGVEVWFTLEGTFKGTLFTDSNGTVTGEFDSQPDTWLTWSSPETGRSYRNQFAARFHNWYPDGVEPGDRVVATATGFQEKIPGLPARAGRTVFPNGTVIVVEDGVPYVDYGEPSRELRDKYSGDEADAAICAHLTGA